MRDEKVIIVSDLHLWGLKDPTMKMFLAFLDEQKGSMSRLIIGGDLFDFWVGFKKVVFYEYIPVLQKLLELRERGIQIDYLEGNHDFHLGPFFKDILKVNVFSHEAFLTLGNYKVYIAHGDEVNAKDYGYRFLRWVLRTSVVRFLCRVTPSSWIWWMSRRSSYVSRNFRKVHPYTKELFREFALKKLQDLQIDVVILGHSHEPDEQAFEINGSKKYYFNVGDWLTHFTYLELTQGYFTLKKYTFDIRG